MKILILSRGVPNSHDPQEGCFELDQAKALKAAGYDVVIMAIDSRVRKFWRKIGIEKKVVGGITTYKLFLFPSSIIRRLLSFKLGIKLEVYQAYWLYNYIIKKEGKFDLIHAHYLTNIFYASHIKDKYNIPIIGTEHWSRVNVNNPARDVCYMATQSYKKANALISVSQSLRKRIIDNFNIDSIVIHNLIDTSYLFPLEQLNNDEIFRITLVGSLIPLKGFDFFLRSLTASELRNKRIEVKIIGGGPEYKTLLSLINELNLNDKVSLLGQRSKKEIFRELNRSNVFILPSYSENFSVSVLEALSNGLPVIATICGGIRECIDSSNGILVEVGDETAMKMALEKMYIDYKKFDKKKIQADCLKQYSPASIVAQIVKVYESILGKDNV